MDGLNSGLFGDLLMNKLIECDDCAMCFPINLYISSGYLSAYIGYGWDCTWIENSLQLAY